MPTKMIKEHGVDEKIMKRLSGSTAPRTLETGNGSPEEAPTEEALTAALKEAHAEIDRLKARKPPAGKAAGGTKTTEVRMDRLAAVVDDLGSRNAALLEERDRLIEEVDRLKKQLAQAGTTDGSKGDFGRLVDIRRVVREDDDDFLVYGITESSTGKRTPTRIEMSVEAYRRFRRLKPEPRSD